MDSPQNASNAVEITDKCTKYSMIDYLGHVLWGENFHLLQLILKGNVAQV